VRLVVGGFGWLPGQFQALAGLTIDKQNRVFTSEQYLGRVQMFRYITNTEAQVEYDRRLAEVAKKAAEKPKAAAEKKPGDKALPPATTTPEAAKPAPPATAEAPPTITKTP